MAEKRKSRGVVVNFHNAKRFGFIKLDGAGEEEADIFVHSSQLKPHPSSSSSSPFRTLRPGDRVEFLLYKEADKLKAADVITLTPTPTPNGRGGGGECYKCGHSGHFARDCYQTTTRTANIANNGNHVNNRNGSGVCYTCGGVGHLARECPTGRKRGCFTCGGVGHVAADCRNSSSGGFQNGGRRGGSFGRFGGGVRACFNCGEQGHMAKDCQQDSVGVGRVMVVLVGIASSVERCIIYMRFIVRQIFGPRGFEGFGECVF